MNAALPQPVAETSARAQAAWAKRRPAWTRTDTARWLNARSASVLAWVRRKDQAGAPGHSNQMGRWLQEYRTNDFSRAHQRLALCGTDEQAREKLNALGVLS